MHEIPRLDPIRFTEQLCEIESTTYNEGRVGDFLADFLAARGWAVEKTAVPQPTESAGVGERWNVYGGTAGQTPDLVFSTHMDTVPPYIPFREDGEFIYGRGVSDAKGIIAAQVAAAEALRSEGYRVGVLFVSGEERDSAGAKVANESPKGSRFLINGEPTDNRLALASKGSLRAVFRAQGKMAHSAYPELGDSAVHKLVEVLGRLLKLEFAGDGRCGAEHAEHRADSWGPRTERDCGQGRGAGAGPAGGRLGAGARGTDRSCRGPGGGGVHAGDSVCAVTRGGGFADDDREIHYRHSAAHELGRAIAAGARFDSCCAHAV